MRVNSKDCVTGGCKHYPCDKKVCRNELAFNGNGKMFIATRKLANQLNHVMKKRIYNLSQKE